MKVLLTLLTLLALSLGSAEEYPIFDFSGGQNTTLFPTVVADNEAVLIRNLIFENGVLKGRYGYARYSSALADTVFGLGSSVMKGLHRSKNGRFYAAWKGYLFKNTDTTSTGSSFDTVDVNDTLASANYLSFADFNDTVWFVDGRNFWKTLGDSLMDGNEVWRGQVSYMLSPEVIHSDKLKLKVGRGGLGTKLVAFPVASKSPLTVFDNFDTGFVGNRGVGSITDDTGRIFLLIDLTDLQSGDSVLSALCSLKVTQELTSNDETLAIHRVNQNFYLPNWNNQPTVSTEVNTTVITDTGWVSLNIATWVDSVNKAQIVNQGLRLKLNDEATDQTAKFIKLGKFGADTTDNLRITISVLRSQKLVQIRPNIIVDTAAAGLWDENRWQGYYVEFLDEVGSGDGDYVRLIDSTSFDTLFLNTGLIDPAWITTRNTTYRIMAYPTSKDNLFTSLSVTGMITFSAPDDIQRINLGTQAGIADGVFDNNRYFLKATKGSGTGVIFQILYNDDSAGTDFLYIRHNSGTVFDTTTDLSIFQTVWPPVKYITVRGNRAYFAGDSLHPSWLWYSESKVLGEVGGLNFIPVGGEPAEGNITSLRSLFVSNYSDPRNPLIIYKAQSVHALFGSDPTTDVPIKILDKIGTVSDRSVISVVDFGQAFQGSDGNFYVTDGQNIKLLSAKIQGNINQTNLAKTASFYLKRNINWSVSNKTLTYNIDNGAWTEQNFRFGVATHLNLATDTLRPYNIAFAHTDSGIVYKYGSSQFLTDPTGVFNPTIKTKWYAMGDPNMVKHLSYCYLHTNFDSSVDTLRVMVSRDSSEVLSATLADTALFIGVDPSADVAMLRYFSKRVTASLFQFTLQGTFAATFKLGGFGVGYQNYKKKGY